MIRTGWFGWVRPVLRRVRRRWNGLVRSCVGGVVGGGGQSDWRQDIWTGRSRGIIISRWLLGVVGAAIVCGRVHGCGRVGGEAWWGVQLVTGEDHVAIRDENALDTSGNDGGAVLGFVPACATGGFLSRIGIGAYLGIFDEASIVSGRKSSSLLVRGPGKKKFATFVIGQYLEDSGNIGRTRSTNDETIAEKLKL